MWHMQTAFKYKENYNQTTYFCVLMTKHQNGFHTDKSVREIPSPIWQQISLKKIISTIWARISTCSILVHDLTLNNLIPQHKLSIWLTWLKSTVLCWIVLFSQSEGLTRDQYGATNEPYMKKIPNVAFISAFTCLTESQQLQCITARLGDSFVRYATQHR